MLKRYFWLLFLFETIEFGIGVGSLPGGGVLFGGWKSFLSGLSRSELGRIGWWSDLPLWSPPTAISRWSGPDSVGDLQSHACLLVARVAWLSASSGKWGQTFFRVLQNQAARKRKNGKKEAQRRSIYSLVKIAKLQMFLIAKKSKHRILQNVKENGAKSRRDLSAKFRSTRKEKESTRDWISTCLIARERIIWTILIFSISLLLLHSMAATGVLVIRRV